MAQAQSLPGPTPRALSVRSTAAWQPWMWSAALHAALVMMLAGGVVLSRMAPPTETALALEAVVVDAQTLAALHRRSAPRAESPPRAEPQVPAQPVPEQPVPEQPVPDEPAAAPPEAPRRAEAPAPSPLPAKPAPVDPAPVKTAPVPSAAAKPLPTKPAPAVVPAVPDAAAREAAERELQAALDEEARITALRTSAAAAQWGAAIRGRVQRAWIRPDTARSGIDCTVAVTQAPGGTVLSVEVRACNGDDAVRQSIEDAVRRASPLPAPPDPALFEREIILRFRPDA
jgi:outer membrane biosynthesis protein TonB